ncbi:hypothetical protein Tco_0068583, partial [Tanacetum coccineum]
KKYPLKKEIVMQMLKLKLESEEESTMALGFSAKINISTNSNAYLEKTEGNVEFHEVIDFLRRSYIYHALTVSHVVSTTFVEQFWTSAKSKTINNVRHITAKVAGKVVSISEASIRTKLIFDGMLRHLEAKKKFVMYPRFISIFLGKVTPLFDTMLVQPTQDEGTSSERLSDEQPSPFPAPTSEVPNESLLDSSFAQPKSTGENLGDHSSNDTSFSGNEDDMTLQNVYDLCISLCKQVSDQAQEAS